MTEPEPEPEPILVSVDVGIRNLAYCVMAADGAICEWRIVDLRQPDGAPAPDAAPEPKGVCSRCRRVAKYTDPTDPAHKWCSAHGFDLALDAARSRSRVQSMSIAELNMLWALRAPQLPVPAEARASKAALLRALPPARPIVEIAARPASSSSSPACDAIPMLLLGQRARDVLDALLRRRPSIAHVVIENQIGPSAVRMRTLQYMLAMFFLVRAPLLSVSFANASNKLGGAAPPLRPPGSPCGRGQEEAEEVGNAAGEEEVGDTAGGEEVGDATQGAAGRGAKAGYDARKAESVRRCRLLLADTPWVDLLADAAKADDLADCFLQGRWWLAASFRSRSSSSSEAAPESFRKIQKK